ncbi:dihydrodipicolinate synthase family protein [Alteromonas sp. 5E99-2]|uniref:dihydrodipicolinate synthase family protein n=1 Tax=Alteromonas sp. 5E99-2 TaxID=2817683 RepID=UPI001A99B3B8|nr:dihydrodipicolinate synthase family protein [Alteromonas sp. 5E99-2]MBO1256485.1 dihydrodipicolinate synthase family protein [Alteromonas sp. 5E99-2]
MFTGLSAFPITPFKQESIDFHSFERIVSRLANAKVDSICAMGSTGLYPYLNLSERAEIVKQCVSISGGIPVMSGIGALRTKDVLLHAEAAQRAGASALLLAPVSYHPLTDNEVFSLYETVCNAISVPLCIYENPRVTQFTFSDELYSAVTRLPNVGAIKIPGTPFGSSLGKARLSSLRKCIPDSVAIGVSADKFAPAGMAAGCDVWLSVIGGLFPQTAQSIMQAIANGNVSQGLHEAENLTPLWTLFENNKGGMRVMATAAAILGYAEPPCLPQPLLPLNKKDTAQLEQLLSQWDLK